MKADNILSILIDESGDFDKYDPRDPFYHVVMVLHEQNNDISDMVISTKHIEKYSIEATLTFLSPILCLIAK